MHGGIYTAINLSFTDYKYKTPIPYCFSYIYGCYYFLDKTTCRQYCFLALFLGG